MSDQLAKLEEILHRAKLTFERSMHDQTTELISAVLNKDTDLRLDIIAIKEGDAFELKFVAWVDDLHDERPADQLRDALTFNFIMALGRFAFQPEIDAIVYVADYPLNLLDDATFQSILDEYYYFGNLYFESFYGSRGEEDKVVGNPSKMEKGVERHEKKASRNSSGTLDVVGPVEEGHD